MHGDTLCTDDLDYQAWRKVARSREWQREFLAKSLPERRKALAALREKSKEVVGAKPAEIMDVNDGAVRELREHRLTRWCTATPPPRAPHLEVAAAPASAGCCRTGTSAAATSPSTRRAAPGFVLTESVISRPGNMAHD